MVSKDFPCYPSLPLPGVRRGRGWEVVVLCFPLQSYIGGAVFLVGLSSSISSQASSKSSVCKPSQEQIPAARPPSRDSHPSVG